MKVEEQSRSLLQELKGLTRLWPHLKDQKKFLFFAVVLIPLVSILEMSVPLVIRWTIDSGISQNDSSVLVWGTGLYLSLVIGQYICRAGQAISASFAVHRMVRSLRKHLIKHVLRLSCSFHDRNMSGRLVTRATSDFDNLSESFNMGVLTSVIDIAVLTGSVVGLLILSWKLALITIIVLPIIGIIVSVFSRALKKTMYRARVRIAELNAFTQECLYGSSTIKLLTAEDDVQTQFDDMNEKFRKAQMNSVILDAFMFSIIDGITAITVGCILYFAVNYSTGGGVITAGLMVAFVQYIQQMFEPVKHLSNKIAMLQGAFTSIDRIFGVLEQQDFIPGDQVPKVIKGTVEFENVTFSYKDDQARPTLKDVSFKLPAGHSLAIVGPTGSGKSTITKLITKLYSGYSGNIFLDGQDIRHIDSSVLRKHLAIVPQDIVIFDGTIKFNISLGLPGVTDEQIRKAACTVGADRFISSLPGGYDYLLKEQGSNLSVGQKQLIAFARALAKNPEMIVLDEATSSVDPESEELIQAGIDSLIHGQTVIVIAHRLSTVRKCDFIMVVENGKLKEWGSHLDLVRNRGHYFNLHQALKE